MTWLVWRRYRLTVGLTLCVMLALGVWMGWQVHAFEAAQRSQACLSGLPGCPFGSNRFFSLKVAVSVVNLALDALPCALGVLFGAPLVAGELDRHTNRLLWTQGISRTRWLVTKYGLLLTVLAGAVAALTLIAQWWSGHVDRPGLLLHTLPVGKVGPGDFQVTGVVAVAYAILAFSLGAAAGALIRRTGWAIFATVLLYLFIVLFMVGIRPSLAPQSFTPWSAHSGIQYPGRRLPVNAWDLGSGYRYQPDYEGSKVQSATLVTERCESPLGYDGPSFFDCLAEHHVQVGELYQPASNYWLLQWREAAILIAGSVLCFGGTVAAVRRWRA